MMIRIAWALSHETKERPRQQPLARLNRAEGVLIHGFVWTAEGPAEVEIMDYH
jgi:hypothetical protein